MFMCVYVYVCVCLCVYVLLIRVGGEVQHMAWDQTSHRLAVTFTSKISYM